MAVFGWLARGGELPERWDLREEGWQLCRASGDEACALSCAHPLLCEGENLARAVGNAGEASQRMARMLVLGVEDSGRRAQLLASGYADALSAAVTLDELAARSLRVHKALSMVPRRRPVGPLILDLLQRDACREGRWIGLHPREFSVLWRLSDRPGEAVSRMGLLEDIWRLRHDPQTNRVEVHLSRLRSKLAGAGCGHLVETVAGGYRLAPAE